MRWVGDKRAVSNHHGALKSRGTQCHRSERCVSVQTRGVTRQAFLVRSARSSWRPALGGCDDPEALRRGRDAERYPCERRRAVAHLDGAETQEGRGAISVDGTAAGPAHDVDVLRLTEERSPEQKSLKVSGPRAVPREANPASEVHAVERDPVKGAARREDPFAGATHR